MLNIPIICEICNSSLKNLNLFSIHLTVKHQITAKKYLFERGLWPKCLNETCMNPRTHLRKGKYCSRQCMDYSFATTKEFKEKQSIGLKKFHLKNPQYLSKFWSEEQKEKQRQITTEIYSNQEFRLRLFENQIKSMSPEVIDQLTKDTTYAMRDVQKEKFKNPEYISSKGKDRFGNIKIKYRNNTELKQFEKLDANPLVISWEYETVCLPYIFNNKKHYIIVDIEVLFSDGMKKLIHIYNFRFNARNLKKLEIIKQYCEMNNLIYEPYHI